MRGGVGGWGLSSRGWARGKTRRQSALTHSTSTCPLCPSACTCMFPMHMPHAHARVHRASLSAYARTCMWLLPYIQYTNMHVYKYPHKHTHSNALTRVGERERRERLQMDTHTHTHACKHTLTHTHTHTHTQTHTHTHARRCALDLHY